MPRLKIYSFLNPIALKGIKWIILRSTVFLTCRFESKDDKSYSATFGQISSKSNEAFLNYAQKPHFLTLIPYNPRIKIFFKKQVRQAMVPRIYNLKSFLIFHFELFT